MIRNYIIVALRHFKRNQVTSIINVLGLSLGLATCLVAGLYIKHDLSADRFHEDRESIFRVTAQMGQFIMNGTPYLFAETAAKEIPEIEATLRTMEMEATLRVNHEIFKNEIIFADANFLRFFTFPLAEGNRDKALSALRQVVISHEMKERHFPGQSALGERIAIQLDTAFYDFEVSGVAQPTPAHSSMYFDFVIPLENRYLKDPQEKQDWGRFFLTTFLKIEPHRVQAVDNALPDFRKRHFPANPQGTAMSQKFVLNPYADHYLGNQSGGGGLRNGKSGQALFIFGGIGLVILLLASFNFMNLANAQASRRAVEVGVKKVVGAGKKQLVRQFLIEALVLSFIACLVSLGLTELGLFMFRDLLQMDISFFDVKNVDIHIGLVIITVITGVLAGIYPAFVLANVDTLKTFKKQFKIGGNNWITRSILSMQFGISITLIACAIIMWKQQTYMAKKDLGFNREQLLAIAFPEGQTSSIDFIKHEIKGLVETVSVTKTTTNFNGQSSIVHQRHANGENTFVYLMSADEDFLATLQMRVVQGEGFKTGQPAPEKSILVNETLLKNMNLQDSVGVALGRNLGAVDHPIIVGVVKDFHHSAMRYNIEPMMIVYEQPMGHRYLLVRLGEKQTSAGLGKIRSIWEKAMPNTPFEFSFVDDNVQKQYEAEVRWSSIITLATGMAVFLSMLGLLGLAMFTAERRRKEIGIRKVLGASITQLVSLLSRDYVWLILTAFAVSVPLSWYVMQNYWLTNFAYKIEVGISIYIVALVVVLSIAGISVGSQTFRAALQNPAETLKEE
jgi:putative ABC transport system permease protein